MPADARRLAGDALAAALRDSRATHAGAHAFDERRSGRCRSSAGVNPIAWELGHLAWFAEFWILRGPHARDAVGLRRRGPAAAHRRARTRSSTRPGWPMPIAGPRRCPAAPTLAATLAAQLDACLDAIPARCRRRRRALLPSPRAVPRRHARRGVRLVAGDAAPGRRLPAWRRCRPCAGGAAAADRRRRARHRPRAHGAGLRVRQRAARLPRCAWRRSRSTPRR